MAFTVVVPQTTMPAAAAANERALYLYYTHTKETARIVFKRNGRYDQKGLTQLNRFLRDWRRNEPAKMDPVLFDLLWSVYNEVGATQPIHVVSAYRSPATNAMLRSKSSGVAENSQHMKGQAMDFFIPGVPLEKLRLVAMRHQVGGVGYYPTSGSPFVHLDTGSVRAWPRLTRAQLQKVFPDGRTLHLPSDGKALSEEGRRYAQAEWQRCRMVPCGSGGSRTMVASNDTGPKQTLMGMLFGGKDEPRQAPVDLIPSGPEQRTVQTVPVAAPIPAARPAAIEDARIVTAAIDPSVPASLPFSTQGSPPFEDKVPQATAPVPAVKSEQLLLATRPALPSEQADTAVLALAAIAPVPAPRAPTDRPEAHASTMTAYAPSIPQDAEAQRALEMIIERSAAASDTARPAEQPRIEADNIRTAALGTTGGLTGLSDVTWTALTSKGAAAAPAAEAVGQRAAVQPLHGVKARPVELVAPDTEHAHETFVQPVALSSAGFAVFFAPDEGNLDAATELGPLVSRSTFAPEPQGLSAERFSAGPLTLASR